MVHIKFNIGLYIYRPICTRFILYQCINFFLCEALWTSCGYGRVMTYPVAVARRRGAPRARHWKGVPLESSVLLSLSGYYSRYRVQLRIRACVPSNQRYSAIPALTVSRHWRWPSVSPNGDTLSQRLRINSKSLAQRASSDESHSLAAPQSSDFHFGDFKMRESS